jgi:two-component system KDP operon response regulator KdpE
MSALNALLPHDGRWSLPRLVPMSATPAPKRGYRICIVDDDQPERKLLRLALEGEGYAVEEASNGQAALSLLRRSHHRFIVLLDMRMPVVSGTSVLRTVANDHFLATRHAFILITAWPDRPPELVSLLQTLSVPVVCKPFDLEELLNTIDQVAGRLQAVS